MKKINILFVVAIIASVMFCGCKKYDEGPTITFRSNVKRITGEWKMTKSTRNGVALSFNANDRYKINKDGTMVYTWVVGSTSTTAPGTWEFFSDDDSLRMTRTYLFVTTTFEYAIKRLSNSELFIERQDGNDLYRVELEKL